MSFVSTSAVIASAFRTLSDELVEETNGNGMQRLVTVAKEVVPGCAWVGVTAVPPSGFPRTVAVTDPVAQSVDDLQYATSEGPCLQAAAEKALVVSSDLSTERRWRDFCARALSGSPVRSVMSLGVSSSAGKSAVNLYGEHPDAFGADAPRVGALVSVLAQALVHQLDAQARAVQLQSALDTNRSIGTAVGILAATRGTTPEQAFETLRRWSMDHNVKISRVAQLVIEAGGLPRTNGAPATAQRPTTPPTRVR
jgi:hypothetical protein